MICPNLSDKKIKAEFDELVSAVGENAAYTVWNETNGNGIDKAPNGEPSKLFSDLLGHFNGDRVKAIKAKTLTYSTSFKAQMNEATQLDENGEPSIDLYKEVYPEKPTPEVEAQSISAPLTKEDTTYESYAYTPEVPDIPEVTEAPYSNANEALNSLKASENALFSKVADVVLSEMSSDILDQVTIEVSEVDLQTKLGKNRPVLAVYIPKEGKILLDKSLFNLPAATIESTILHEIIHASTVHALTAKPESGKALRALHEEYVAAHPNDASTTEFFEFVAELFSSNRVFDAAEKITTGKKSFIERLWDAIANLFSPKDKAFLANLKDLVHYNNAVLDTYEETDIDRLETLTKLSEVEERSMEELLESATMLHDSAVRKLKALPYHNITPAYRKSVETISNQFITSFAAIKESMSPDVYNNAKKYLEAITQQVQSFADALITFNFDKSKSSNQTTPIVDLLSAQFDKAIASNDRDALLEIQEKIDQFDVNFVSANFNLFTRLQSTLRAEHNYKLYSTMLGQAAFEGLLADLEGIIAELNHVGNSKGSNLGYKFSNLRNRMASAFIYEQLDAANDPAKVKKIRNWKSFDSDINFYTRYFGTLTAAPTILKIFRKALGDADREVTRAMYKYYPKLKAASKKVKDATMILEKDENGKATGYLMRDRKYGVWENIKREFRENWLKSKNYLSMDDLRANPTDWRQYTIDFEKLKAANVERQYTPEYYSLFANLSVKASHELAEKSIEINDLVSMYRDADGRPQLQYMTQNEYDAYQEAVRDKRNLANPYNADGSEKTGDARDVAEELTALYDKLQIHMKSTVNSAKFWEEAKRVKEMGGFNTEGRDLYETWVARNTYIGVTEAFLELLSKQDRAEYGEAYDNINRQRRYLLEHYTDENGDVNFLTMPEKVKQIIREADVYLDAIRAASAKPESKSLYKVVLTNFAESFLQDGNSFDSKDFYYNSKGRKVKHSYLTKVIPLTERSSEGVVYYGRVPNRNWRETDSEATYYNKKYDRSIKDKEQPRLDIAKYDNREAYAKLMRDPGAREYYNAIYDANEYALTLMDQRNPNPYKIGQQRGNHWAYIKAKGFWSGTKQFVADYFTIQGDDVEYGITRAMGPGGQPIDVISTPFTSALDDPSVITRYVTDATVNLVRSGVNYSVKKRLAPVLRAVHREIQISGRINKNGGISANNSNIEKRLYQLMEGMLYGRSADTKSFRYPVLKREGLKPKFEMSKRRISVDKVVRSTAAWARNVSLGWNIYAAIAGGVSALNYYTNEAMAGTVINKKDLSVGSLEMFGEMATFKQALQLGKTTSSNKMFAMLEYNGISFHEAETMANTDRSRVSRAFRALTKPYAVWQAASVIPNATFARAIYNNYRLITMPDGTKQFMSEYEFVQTMHKELDSKFNVSDKKDREKLHKMKKNLYSTYTTTLWDAYEVTDTGFTVKKEYAPYVSTQLESEIGAKIAYLSSHSEGNAEKVDKGGLHYHAALSTIFMFRNFLAKNIENTAAPIHYNYELKRIWMGTMSSLVYFWFYGERNNIINEKRQKLLDELNVSNEELSDAINVGLRRLSAQVCTWVFFIGLWNILQSAITGDGEPDDDFMQDVAALLLYRSQLEIGSRYNTDDLFGILNSVSPAMGPVLNLASIPASGADALVGSATGTPQEPLQSGVYQGYQPWQRDLMRSIPVVNAYMRLTHPKETLRSIQATVDK